MRFGQRVRQLRVLRGLTQREVATEIGVGDTYISKVERGNLRFGDYPSEKFIHRLAEVLKAVEEELLLLAGRVPTAIRQRVRERPEVFRKLAGLDDEALDGILAQVEAAHRKPETESDGD